MTYCIQSHLKPICWKEQGESEGTVDAIRRGQDMVESAWVLGSSLLLAFCATTFFFVLLSIRLNLNNL